MGHNAGDRNDPAPIGRLLHAQRGSVGQRTGFYSRVVFGAHVQAHGRVGLEVQTHRHGLHLAVGRYVGLYRVCCRGRARLLHHVCRKRRVLGHALVVIANAPAVNTAQVGLRVVAKVREREDEVPRHLVVVSGDLIEVTHVLRDGVLLRDLAILAVYRVVVGGRYGVGHLYGADVARKAVVAVLPVHVLCIEWVGSCRATPAAHRELHVARGVVDLRHLGQLHEEVDTNGAIQNERMSAERGFFRLGPEHWVQV